MLDRLKNRTTLHVFLIILVYLFAIKISHPEIYSYRFNQETVSNYLRSQDIEDREDKIKDRIHISDSDIYIASGYLYATGSDPTDYNFQHAPLIKYLLGFSSVLFNNPYIVQIVFGALLLSLTYLLGSKVLKNANIGLLASGLLLLDPLFMDLVSGTLLDLGQAVFVTIYFYIVTINPGNILVQGILLGAIGASKSWTTSVFLFVLVYFYKIFIKREKINIKRALVLIGVAIITFAMTYLKTFIDTQGEFNIFFWQLKILKFLVDHDTSTFTGGNLVLFATGYFKEWWQDAVFVRKQLWHPLWPVMLAVGVYNLFVEKRDKYYYLIYLFPILYLLYISTAAPFSRYYILMIPCLYLGLSKIILTKIKK